MIVRDDQLRRFGFSNYGRLSRRCSPFAGLKVVHIPRRGNVVVVPRGFGSFEGIDITSTPEYQAINALTNHATAPAQYAQNAISNYTAWNNPAQVAFWTLVANAINTNMGVAMQVGNYNNYLTRLVATPTLDPNYQTAKLQAQVMDLVLRAQTSPNMLGNNGLMPNPFYRDLNALEQQYAAASDAANLAAVQNAKAVVGYMNAVKQAAAIAQAAAQAAADAAAAKARGGSSIFDQVANFVTGAATTIVNAAASAGQAVATVVVNTPQALASAAVAAGNAIGKAADAVGQAAINFINSNVFKMPTVQDYDPVNLITLSISDPIRFRVLQMYAALLFSPEGALLGSIASGFPNLIAEIPDQSVAAKIGTGVVTQLFPGSAVAYVEAFDAQVGPLNPLFIIGLTASVLVENKRHGWLGVRDNILIPLMKWNLDYVQLIMGILGCGMGASVKSLACNAVQVANFIAKKLEAQPEFQHLDPTIQAIITIVDQDQQLIQDLLDVSKVKGSDLWNDLGDALQHIGAAYPDGSGANAKLTQLGKLMKQGKDVLAAIAKFVWNNAGAISTAASDVAQAIKDALNAFVNAALNLPGTIDEMLTLLGKGAGAAYSAITSIKPNFDFSFSFFGGNGNFLQSVIDEIENIFTALGKVNLWGIGNAFKAMVGPLTAAMGQISDLISKLMQVGLSGAATAAQQLMSAAGDAISKAEAAVANAASLAAQVTTSALQAVAMATAQAAQATAQAAVNLVAGGSDLAKALASVPASVLGTLGAQLQGLQARANAALNNIGQVITQISNWVAQTVQNVPQAIDDAGQAALSAAQAAISAAQMAGQAAFNAIQDAGTQAAQIADAATKAAARVAGQAALQLAQAAVSAASDAASLVAKVPAALLGALSTTVNAVQGAAKMMLDSINKVLAQIENWHPSVPIPSLPPPSIQIPPVNIQAPPINMQSGPAQQPASPPAPPVQSPPLPPPPAPAAAPSIWGPALLGAVGGTVVGPAGTALGFTGGLLYGVARKAKEEAASALSDYDFFAR